MAVAHDQHQPALESPQPPRREPRSPQSPQQQLEQEQQDQERQEQQDPHPQEPDHGKHDDIDGGGGGGGRGPATAAQLHDYILAAAQQETVPLLLRNGITHPPTLARLCVLLRARHIALASLAMARTPIGIEQHLRAHFDACALEAGRSFDGVDRVKGETAARLLAFAQRCVLDPAAVRALRLQPAGQDVLLLPRRLAAGAQVGPGAGVSVCHVWGHGGRLVDGDEASEPHTYRAGAAVRVASRFAAKRARVAAALPGQLVWMDVFDVDQGSDAAKGRGMRTALDRFVGQHVCVVAEAASDTPGGAVRAVFAEGLLDRAWPRAELIHARNVSIACNDALVLDFGVALCWYLSDALALSVREQVERFNNFDGYADIRLLQGQRFSASQAMRGAQTSLGIDYMVAGLVSIAANVPEIDYSAKDLWPNWERMRLYGHGHEICRMHVDLAMPFVRPIGQGLLCTRPPYSPMDSDTDDPYLCYKGVKYLSEPATAIPHLQGRTTRALSLHMDAFSPSVQAAVEQVNPVVLEAVHIFVIGRPQEGGEAPTVDGLRRYAMRQAASAEGDDVLGVYYGTECSGRKVKMLRVCEPWGPQELGEKKKPLGVDMVAVLEETSTVDGSYWRCLGLGAVQTSANVFESVERLHVG